jgi:hypothetical protein
LNALFGAAAGIPLAVCSVFSLSVVGIAISWKVAGAAYASVVILGSFRRHSHESPGITSDFVERTVLRKLK